MIRSLLSMIGLIVACAGIGLFVALGIYVWTLKAELNQQASTLSKRANDAGDEADRAIAFVRDVISNAEKDLKNASEQPAKPASFFEQIAARKASQQLAGSVDRARGAVVTASDTVVVAEAALRVFDDNPELKRLLGIQPGQVDAATTVLGNVSGELRQAQSVLGGAPTPEQLNSVDRALGQASRFTDDLARVVTTVRGRVDETKSMVDRWAWRIALATTLMCSLAAIGQVFLARFCWRTLRGLPA